MSSLYGVLKAGNLVYVLYGGNNLQRGKKNHIRE